MATAVTSVEHGDHSHEHGLDLKTRITRARVGGLLLILSDVGFVAAMYASQGYLSVLNMQHQYRPAGDNPPSVGTGLILTLVAVLSAAAYYWGFYGLRHGQQSRYRTGVATALALVLIAFVAQIIVVAGLKYPTPIHGFDSLVIVMTAYHAVHLFISGLLGTLLLGRIKNNRIAGHEYVAEVCGYWWFYVALSAVTTWFMVSFVP